MTDRVAAIESAISADRTVGGKLSEAWQNDTLTTCSGSPGAGSLAIPACPTTDRRQFAEVCRRPSSRSAGSSIFGRDSAFGVLVFSVRSDTQQFRSARDYGRGRNCRCVSRGLGRQPVRERTFSGTRNPGRPASRPTRCGSCRSGAEHTKVTTVHEYTYRLCGSCQLSGRHRTILSRLQHS